jgi:hypothetical protein
MTHVRALNSILLVMFGFGLGEGRFAPGETHADLHLVASLIIGYLFFLWYASDADLRGIARSRLLSVAMVLLPLLALPYYLLRSRQVEERGNALGAFLGLLVLMPLARLAGVGIHLALVHAFP